MTGSPIPSPSATATLTATPSVDGPLRLERAVAFPNPFRGPLLRLRYRAEAAAETLELRLYSAAEVLVLRQDLPGPSQAGWQEVLARVDGLAPGFYAARLCLRDGGRSSEALGLKLYRLP